jgi:hypothetical protein
MPQYLLALHKADDDELSDAELLPIEVRPFFDGDLDDALGYASGEQ